MRTNTIQEKVFDHSHHSLQYSQRLYAELANITELYRSSGFGLNDLFEKLCNRLETVPLYHDIELLISQGIIKICLQVSVKNTFGETYGIEFEDCGPKYWHDEHQIVLGIADFIDGHENGDLKYNPAEGF